MNIQSQKAKLVKRTPFRKIFALVLAELSPYQKEVLSTHTHEPEQIINKHEITAGQLTLSLKAVGIGEVQPDANQIQLFQ